MVETGALSSGQSMMSAGVGGMDGWVDEWVAQSGPWMPSSRAPRLCSLVFAAN
jgi:hypothetical protein